MVLRFVEVDIGDCPVDAEGKGQGNGCLPGRVTFLDRIYEKSLDIFGSKRRVFENNSCSFPGSNSCVMTFRPSNN